MNRGDIRKAIKNEVDDQTIDDALANSWVQRADEKVQSWRPSEDKNQTFDYWDYLKTEQASIHTRRLPSKRPIQRSHRVHTRRLLLPGNHSNCRRQCNDARLCPYIG